MSILVAATGANGVPVSGAHASSTWHYKTTTSYEEGTTDLAGKVTLSRGISSASAGYTVFVDVTVSQDGTAGTARTSFTPQTC